MFSYLSMKFLSLSIFPFMLFRTSRALHFKSSFLFKFYINPENQQISESLESQLQGYYYNENQPNVTLTDKFYDFRALKIRPWDFNKIIKQQNFYDNFLSLIKSTYSYFFGSQRQETGLKFKNMQISDPPMSKLEKFSTKKAFIWRNDNNTFLDSLKNRFIFYDEYDFLCLLFGTMLIRKKIKLVNRIWTRK